MVSIFYSNFQLNTNANANFAGMLSKVKGQILCIAAAMSVLFSDSVDDNGKIVVSSVPSIISTTLILGRCVLPTCSLRCWTWKARGRNQQPFLYRYSLL